MKACSDESLFERFQAASVHGVAFDDLHLITNGYAAEWRERARAAVAASNLTAEAITDFPAVREWRAAYQRFGLKPSKYRSSVEQLYRRALKGDLINTHLPLVNLYCYVSIICAVPMGGYDLSKSCGDIIVRAAKTGDQFRGIGDGTESASQDGVIVYADAQDIICWAWNFRDAERTSLSEGTQRAIFFADSSIGESRARAENAITMLSDALASAGCINRGAISLDAQTREVHVQL